MSDDPIEPQKPTVPYESAAVARARDVLNVMPDSIGRYRILERIGGGGMGEVYRAEQRSPVRREVAIKLIKLGMDTKLVIARFEAERQALAMMDHPNIAKVYDASSDDTGRPYFVMEYVKGKPITEYADANHLTINERLALFEQVCNAVQHAHHKGIIHRDLKPSNALVSTHDGKPYAKIIDFGIAKATSHRLTDMTLYTQHDQFIGTPQYMSPEQADGSLDIDTRTDVYSLGVLLYELLTGSTPFAGAEMKQAAMERIKQMIREVDPPKPSTRLGMSTQTLPTLAASRRVDVKKLGSTVRGELDWIVMKALEKDRARRYDTPASMVEDVERYLNGQPVEAAPPSWRYRAKKFTRKYKAPIFAGAILTAFLILGLIGTWVGLLRARTALAREKEANAREQLARSDAQLEAFAANISSARIAMDGNSWPEARQRLAACPIERRGWEWDFLNSRSFSPEFGFSEPVWQTTLSDNAKFLLCCSGLEAHVIDVPHRKVIQTVYSARQKYRDTNGNEGYEWQYPVMDEEGGLLVQKDREFVVYSPTGSIRHTITLPKFLETDRIGDLEIGPRGAYAAILKAGRYLIFEAATGESLCELPAANVGLVFDKDDSEVAWQNLGEVLIGECRSGKTLFKVRPDFAIQTWCVSDDFRLCAVTSPGGRVAVYDTGNQKKLADFALAKGAVGYRVRFNTTGKRLVVGEGDQGCSVWDVPTQVQLAGLDKSTSVPRFTADDSKILDPRSGYIWDWQTGSGERAVRYPAGASASWCFSNDGKVQITLNNYRVQIWDTDRPSHDPVTSTADVGTKLTGPVCATIGGRECSLDAWNEAVADAVHVVIDNPSHEKSPAITVTSPDGRWIASANPDNSITVRDSKTSATVATLAGSDGQVRAMAVTPDGSRLVSGADDATIKFWDTSAWQEVASMRGNSAITDLAFTRDASRLVIVSADHSIQSWDRRNQAQRDTDREAELNERTQSIAYVDALVAGPVAWEKMGRAIVEDSGISPQRRIAALDELQSRIGAAQQGAAAEADKLKTKYVSKAAMLSEIAHLNVSKLARKAMEQAIDDWDPSPDEVISAVWEILSHSTQSEVKYAEAMAAFDALGLSGSTDPSALRDLAAEKYRAGDYPKTLEVCQRGLAIAGGSSTKIKGASAIQSDFCAIQAMAQAKIGKPDDAKASLLKSISLARRFSDDNVQYQAAQMIQPAATQPTQLQRAAAFASLQGAIDSQDVNAIKANAGKEVTIKGRVADVEATAKGGHLNMFLDSKESGILVFIRSSVATGFEEGFANALVGRDILVHGPVEIYGQGDNKGSNDAWKGRVQLTMESRDDLQLVSIANGVATTMPVTKEVLASTSQPSDSSIHVLTQDEMYHLPDLANQRVSAEANVISAVPTKTGGSLNITMEPEGSGVLVFVPESSLKDLDASHAGSLADAVEGKRIRINGKLVVYAGKSKSMADRMQIILKDPSQLQIIGPASAYPAAPKRPSTSPAKLLATTQPFAGSAIDLNATDTAAALSAVGQVAKISAVVKSTRPSAKGTSLAIHLSDEEGSLTVFVPNSVYPDFNKQLSDDAPKKLVGRTITATGRVKLFRNAPEIEVSNLSDISIAAGPLGTQPTTQSTTQPAGQSPNAAPASDSNSSDDRR